MRLHHIGIASQNIDESVKDYYQYHDVKKKSSKIYDELQKAELVFIETNEGVNIEFVQGQPVDNILAKGISFYHICYEVNDIKKSIEDLRTKGAIIVSPIKPAILFDNRNVAFLYTKSGLIELLEEKK